MNTENWNDITMTPRYDEKTLKEYDGLIGLTLVNLFTLSKDCGAIRMDKFDKENKEHLFFLRVALIARDVYQVPIEMSGSRWEIFCLNWKIRKNFKKVKRVSGFDTGNFDISAVLDFMRPDAIKRIGTDFSFADIYDAYYEGSLS